MSRFSVVIVAFTAFGKMLGMQLIELLRVSISACSQMGSYSRKEKLLSFLFFPVGEKVCVAMILQAHAGPAGPPAGNKPGDKANPPKAGAKPAPPAAGGKPSVAAADAKATPGKTAGKDEKMTPPTATDPAKGAAGANPPPSPPQRKILGRKRSCFFFFFFVYFFSPTRVVIIGDFFISSYRRYMTIYYRHQYCSLAETSSS